MPTNHNKGQPGEKTVRAQEWHVYLGGNQQLSNGVKTCSPRGKTYTVWKPSASEVMDTGGESATTTLLNQHNPKQFTILCPYAKINGVSAPH